MMDIGSMRHKITLQSLDKTATDGGGNYNEVWDNVADVWAKVSPISGQQFIIAGQHNQQLTHTVSMRYRADITPAMRFLYRGRILRIQYIQNIDERNIELRINCIEVETNASNY
jgi:SPP1 family predicted phage head-tail adaptor